MECDKGNFYTYLERNKNSVIAIIRIFISTIKRSFTVLKAFFTSLWNGIKSVTIRVWNAIKTALLILLKVCITVFEKY